MTYRGRGAGARPGRSRWWSDSGSVARSADDGKRTPGVQPDAGDCSSGTSGRLEGAGGGKAQEVWRACDVVRRIAVPGVTQIGGEQRQPSLYIGSLSIPGHEA